MILGIESGDGFQDGFEGTQCFVWLCEIESGCSAPKILVGQASLLN